ncbi:MULTISPECIES: ATP-binding cassette domain-containing protein [unclassified Novosphingobium]|uniref:ATP-binding cassette domain-containing protein n=1 Tax=unclassified Novosphingobium TaxID=2644732 RepID=UPI00086CF498|nr:MULTISPECIES: ATP-binding cassette domain-containing protein [unclassified Novosphingobium]MBN9144559.1 ATP-binding cassette domain-containing protein [Novosphingobium sp.]MDR6707891.1 ATP-binding cassette subfamily C protein CydC [Novosphingobium sp. 1748]ODU84101.1 MAG: ABC transporter [Novosphingobium sp. SCN 63-17]OJX93654.1 MAG: ABC transporter [Novosphingobium sp. 63-713]
MSGLLDAPLAGQKRALRWGMVCAGGAALAAIGLLGVAGCFLVGAGVAGLAGPLAVAGFNYLLPSAAIRAAAITRTAGRYGERMLGHRAALFALAELRAQLFARVAQGALNGRDPGRSGAMAARFGRDVDLLEDAAIRRVARVGGWTGGLAGLAMVGLLGWGAAMVMALGMAAMRLVSHWLAARLPALQAQVAQAHAAAQADYADMAGPAADIAVYDLAPQLAAALESSDMARAEHALARAEAVITASQTILASVIVALIAWSAQGGAPMLALGLLAAMAALEIWAGLAAHDARAPQVRQAEARLQAMESAQTPHPPALTSNPALHIAGRDFAPGARILLSGPSGIGKTRLLETLAGLREDAPQVLRVDGIDPRTLGLAGLRGTFAVMTQDAPLIAGSLADNLALARPGIDRAAMERALWVACAQDIVPLDQWLGGDGARLSGGQRRRVALARALLAGRPWLLLDEPSEGLDRETEALLCQRLKQWLDQTGTGLVLVSHRPAMAQLAAETVNSAFRPDAANRQ